MIHWNLSKEALLHSNITGSCTLISNPLPMSDLDVLACDYRSSTIVVDKYTVTINFIIYNITQSCHIYCYSANYFEKKLLMASTIVTMNTTDNPLMPPTSTLITLTPNSNVTFNQTSSSSTKSLPTASTVTNPTEQRAKEWTATNLDTYATIESLLILAVVAIFLLMIITFVTLMLVIWISFKGTKSKISVV